MNGLGVITHGSHRSLFPLWHQAAGARRPGGIPWIESLGGQYETDPNLPDNPVVLISLAGKQISDDDLDRLDEFPQLHFLDLSSTAITDAGLAQVANLATLQFLDLSGTRISDAGLNYLGELTALQGLTVSQARVTARGVANLQKLLPRCKIKR